MDFDAEKEKDESLLIKKIQNFYDSDGLLRQYPARRPLRIPVLARIAERFEQDRVYTEKQVNEIIRESISFGDIELVRRELFENRFINRKRDGSEYWIDSGKRGTV